MLTLILQIPRIRPRYLIDIIKIKEKLQNTNLTIYKTEQNENKIYMGIFPLVNKGNRKEVIVPTYKERYCFKK